MKKIKGFICKKIENFMNPPDAVYSKGNPYCGNPIETFFFSLGFCLTLLIVTMGVVFDKRGLYTLIAEIATICIMAGLGVLLEKGRSAQS